MATCSSILAWTNPWTKDPGRPQSPGCQRVRHNWSAHTLMIRKYMKPLPVEGIGLSVLDKYLVSNQITHPHKRSGMLVSGTSKLIWVIAIVGSSRWNNIICRDLVREMLTQLIAKIYLWKLCDVKCLHPWLSPRLNAHVKNPHPYVCRVGSGAETG